MYRRIDHLALDVADLARSTRFYEENFGFETYAHDTVPGGLEIAYLGLGDTVLELVGRTSGAMTGYHFCLETDDFDAAVADLTAKGIRVHTAPHPVSARVPREEGWRRAVFEGPDGEHIEIRG